MRLEMTDDEIAVQEVFAGFFADQCPPDAVREAADLGHSPDLWKRLAEMGAPGMAVAVEHGGGGATLSDLAVVAAEAGRRLAPVPLIEHAVAVRGLIATDPGHDAVADLVAGDRIATLALRAAIEGEARLVPGGAVADVVLGLADGALVVGGDAAPGAAQANTGDLALANRTLGDGQTLAAAGETEWRRMVSEWQALTAVGLTGLAQEALSLGTTYAMEREQFGVPVGSFQAVQHGFANVATSLEGAVFLAHKAVWALDSGNADADRLAAMAFLFAGETAQACAAASLQYHGGYGYAEEYDIQLYYRQAKARTLVLGPPSAEYRRLADVVLAPDSTEGAAA